MHGSAGQRVTCKDKGKENCNNESACVSVCMCVPVKIKVSSSVGNGCDPLKLLCDPLEFQQLSQSDPLNLKG